MRGTRTFLAAAVAGLLAGAACDPAVGGVFHPPVAPAMRVAGLDDLPPPRADMDLSLGASVSPEALFRLPDAAEPPIEGPFARYAERRNSRASLVPWDFGQGDERFALNATFFPLVGGALLLVWLALSEWRPTLRRERRRRRSSSRNPSSSRSTLSAAR